MNRIRTCSTVCAVSGKPGPAVAGQVLVSIKLFMTAFTWLVVAVTDELVVAGFQIL